jgi:hypothetical protein
MSGSCGNERRKKNAAHDEAQGMKKIDGAAGTRKS